MTLCEESGKKIVAPSFQSDGYRRDLLFGVLRHRSLENRDCLLIHDSPILHNPSSIHAVPFEIMKVFMI
jgi:hypothetical protein